MLEMRKRSKEILNRIMEDVKKYIWGAVALLLYYLAVHLFSTAFCPMIRVTGIPCAGCGLTRAMLFLLTGQIRRAFFINPMIFPVVVFGLYCVYFRYIKGTRIKGFTLLLSCLAGLMIISFLYRMYLYFPDRTPYVYTRNNLFANHLPFYQKWIMRLINGLRSLRAN